MLTNSNFTDIKKSSLLDLSSIFYVVYEVYEVKSKINKLNVQFSKFRSAIPENFHAVSFGDSYTFKTVGEYEFLKVCL